MKRTDPAASTVMYVVLAPREARSRARYAVLAETPDRETVVRWMAQGRFASGIRIVCVNRTEGRSLDVTDTIVRVLRERDARRPIARTATYHSPAAPPASSEDNSPA